MTTLTAPDATAKDATATASMAAALPRFIQCRTSAARYEWLRLQGDLMKTIVLEAVTAYRAEVDAHGGAPRPTTLDGGRQVTYNIRLDNDLYTWLRTTACDARVSINSLVCAALAYTSAGHV